MRLPRHDDLCTMLGLAMDGELCTDGLGALAHDAEAEVVRQHAVHIEADAVIVDAQFRALGLAAQPHIDLAGGGVCRGFGEGFRSEPVEADFYIERQITFDNRGHVHGDARPAGGGFGQLLIRR